MCGFSALVKECDTWDENLLLCHKANAVAGSRVQFRHRLYAGGQAASYVCSCWLGQVFQACVKCWNFLQPSAFHYRVMDT